jgi:hypothetical protein
MQNLDGGPPLQKGILGLIDLAEAALAQQAHDLKIAKMLSCYHRHANESLGPR